MELNIRKLRENVFRLDIRTRVNGHEHRKRVLFHGDRIKAEKRYFEIRDELHNKNPNQTVPKINTFGDLLSIYIEQKKALVTWNRFAFEKLKKDLGHIPLNFFVSYFSRYLSELKNQCSKKFNRPYSAATINRIFIYANAAFNFGVRFSLIEKNPLCVIKKLREIPRDRILTVEERSRLFSVLSQHPDVSHLYYAVLFALQVPIRKTELINLEKDLLDLKNMTIRIPFGRTKNMRGTYIPVPPNMVNYFRNLPAETNYLFYRKDKDGCHRLGDFKIAWWHALRLANIQNFHFHDTRHCAVTSMINNGTSQIAVTSIANWTTDMLRVYYHVNAFSLAKQAKFS